MNACSSFIFYRVRSVRGFIWNPLWQQRRCKYKKKWAVNRLHRTPSQLALEHFDMFYQPVFGQSWPSIRIALLSSQKYCALVNTFGEYKNILDDLEKMGAMNVMDSVERSQVKNSTDSMFVQDVQNESSESEACKMEKRHHELSHENVNWHASHKKIFSSVSAIPSDDNGENTKSEVIDEKSMLVEKTEKSDLLSGDCDLYDFIPPEKVYSDKHILLQEEIRQSTFSPANTPINIIPDSVTVPVNLKVFVYERGDVSDFPAPQTDQTGLLGYYLMDAASVLPVIALNLTPEDSVLDLCAAPGGKTLTILQTETTDTIVCVDKSNSRLQRLKSILKWYVPSLATDRLQILKMDGSKFTEQSFDKVLVDVPCSTDRHVLTVDENNLFKPGRMSERLQLPTLQRELLVAGIRACKPGGSVVYSTCTLSPAQNEGVIQSTFEYMWRETGIDLAVQDISSIADMFSDTFNFHTCRFGQLVLPSLTANFGPMYICKIKKLK